MFSKVVDEFYPKSKELRTYFESLYQDQRAFKEKRFVWDFWHVEGHYHHLRTPAYHFFPKKIYDPFHKFLVEWGRKNLGCHDISPPWLSLYPEGSYQNLHVDEPHGPFAFVYSLTKNPKSFSGGRTLISKEKLKSKSLEWKRPVEKMKHKVSIDPKLNRLIVFDPSYPHGVSKVSGVEDPLKMRLVLHGWFVQPRPFWYGPLNAKEIQRGLDHWFDSCEVLKFFDSLEGKKGRAGYLGLKLKISSNGRVSDVQIMASTLDLSDREKDKLNSLLGSLEFSKKGKATVLAFPMVIND